MDERILFHVDVNSAFLSWTAVRRLRDDPGSVDLRQIPAAVCGDVETRHGVILAKSIPAKAFGVHTGEAVMTALKKCPRLLLVPSEFSTYRDASRRLMAMLREVSPYLEQLSIDEAFLDVTHRTGRDGAPALAEELKDRIRETLGFTVNVGISTNRLLAKTASDFTKPDRVHVLWPEDVPARLWPLPIGDLFGCGRATAEKLRSIGIATIGDAAHTPPGVLTALLGPRGGAHLLESAWGRSSDRLVCDPEDAKGYSREETTPVDIDADNFEAAAVPLIRTLSESVAGRLRHALGKRRRTPQAGRRLRINHRLLCQDRRLPAPLSSDHAQRLHEQRRGDRRDGAPPRPGLSDGSRRALRQRRPGASDRCLRDPSGSRRVPPAESLRLRAFAGSGAKAAGIPEKRSRPRRHGGYCAPGRGAGGRIIVIICP